MVTSGVLAQVAAIGPYFAVTAGPRGDSAGFRPLADLYTDRSALEGYVQAVAQRLGTGQRRVAASTLHLGTASRLWSVALACTALTGRVPDLGPDRLWWRQARTGPVDLWLPEVRDLPRKPAEALHETVAVQNLMPLSDAMHRVCGVSPHTLRGNAASALVGALRVLLARAPHAPYQVTPLARGLLEQAPLAGAGAFDTAPGGAIGFRRRSCCLYYRVPGAGTCGDCVLNQKETTA
ncbi:(2Fe-2S)-binding protein [Streptomyces sp. ISL-43]|uniref:(2Fe-2S)-binding protein n=1 Tax=Streptomyces sp. ISL-43 TaxID=2819183 RepID=UPI001BE9DA48|nr:(2Fe-2S)-binding protein [Streptomyces sp. ISL-43]MBT2451403.1 (2Fe-2S)-binding protein [Streptomyces sp. ISL-43]